MKLPYQDVSSSTVFAAYRQIHGSDMEDSIEGETTGNLENLLLAVGTSRDRCAGPAPRVPILLWSVSPQ